MDSSSTQQEKEQQPFVCSKCAKYLQLDNQGLASVDPKEHFQSVCSVCMGLWQHDSGITTTTNTIERLKEALEEACEPYGGMTSHENRFARLPNHCPTASFAGDILLRYQLFANRPTTTTKSVTPFSVYQRDLKQYLYSQLESIIKEARKHCDTTVWLQQEDHSLAREEQGFLSVHILCVPPKDSKPPFIYVPKNAVGKKRKRSHHRSKPFTSQGGDPRINLEARLEAQGYTWISQSTAEDIMSSIKDGDTTRLLLPATLMEFHVAVFRRPMVLYGYYTKSRRDVSQTPFHVMRQTDVEPQTTVTTMTTTATQSNATTPTTCATLESPSKKEKTKTTETLGVTSVEEQICGPIENMLGISVLNNPPSSKRLGCANHVETYNNKEGLLYGMIKFHGSGREDMDVRMLVRSDSSTCQGRPFCVQIVDALRPIHSKQHLTSFIKSINHNSPDNSNKSITPAINRPSSYNSQAISYGNNPLGVGISPSDFKFVSSKVFSGLQQSTETKIKHYGCYCWSNKVLTLHHLNEDMFGKNYPSMFPLTIFQKTPIRVLHRRANLRRERVILSAKSIRIDNHHFWLSLTTSAGTYVKEFVGGDLGRTNPSISSLLGSKVSLLELDCEGIEIPENANVNKA
jgi:tRNA U54 and U55 pseudouridine synthase Pus10